MADIRDAWRAKSWDEMARENALAAIMTTPEMMASADMSQERLQAFFDRGRELYERYVKPLAPPEGMLVEYGCGAGRILRAVCDDGRACAGVDISPTMIELCRQFVPEAEAHVLQAGRSGLPDACASLKRSLGGQGNTRKAASAADMSKLRQFAQCMRQHGLSDWPDPNEDGSFSPPSRITQGGKGATGSQMAACGKLLPGQGLIITQPGSGGQ